MIAVLEGINRDCFNDFKLRVGMCNGPLVAGKLKSSTFLTKSRGKQHHFNFLCDTYTSNNVFFSFEVLLVPKNLNMIFGVIP
jgi:hypothetical protein